MKTMQRIFAAAAAAVALVACTNDFKETQKPEVSLVPVEFCGSADTNVDDNTKTVLNNLTVKWEDTDRVSLLSGENFSTNTMLTISNMAEDASWANFEGLAAEQSQEYIAIYPYSSDYQYADGAVNVNIPTEQTAILTTFPSGANVSIAYTSDDQLRFRNVGAVVGYTMYSSVALNTASLTIRFKKSDTEYCALTGSAAVKINAETNLPEVGAASADYVTLLAPEGGFVGGTYYVAVYPPGDYVGYEVEFTELDGKVVKWVKNEAETGTLGRNQKIIFSNIPEPYNPPLPDTIEMLLEFDTKGEWAFNEDIVASGSRDTTNGDKYTYTYSYQHNGLEQAKDFSFFVKAGSGGSYSSTKDYEYLGMGTVANARIKLPAIEGRYLKKVKVEVQNDYSKEMRLLTASVLEFVDFPAGVTASAPGELVFPVTVENETFTTSVNTAYWLGFKSASTHITKIHLTFTATEPTSDSTEGSTDSTTEATE